MKSSGNALNLTLTDAASKTQKEEKFADLVVHNQNDVMIPGASLFTACSSLGHIQAEMS